MCGKEETSQNISRICLVKELWPTFLILFSVFQKFYLLSIYCLSHLQSFCPFSCLDQFSELIKCSSHSNWTGCITLSLSKHNLTIDCFQHNRTMKLYSKRIAKAKIKHIIIPLKRALIIITKKKKLML